MIEQNFVQPGFWFDKVVSTPHLCMATERADFTSRNGLECVVLTDNAETKPTFPFLGNCGNGVQYSTPKAARSALGELSANTTGSGGMSAGPVLVFLDNRLFLGEDSVAARATGLGHRRIGFFR